MKYLKIFLFIMVIFAFIALACTKPDPTETEVWLDIGSSGQPSFQNNWSNTGTGSNCGYMENYDNFISLRGTVSTTGGLPSVIFYLPQGHCPDEDRTFNGGAVTVKAYVPGTGSAVESTVSPVTLDGISFCAEK